MKETIENQTFIIFGSTGDLARRKLFPALYTLFKQNVITGSIPIIAVSRRELSADQFIGLLEPETFMPRADRETLSRFFAGVHYCRMNIEAQEGIAGFSTLLSRLDNQGGCRGNKTFYFATPAEKFDPATQILKMSGALAGQGTKKVVFEKPFGSDLASARKLNECIRSVFDEERIFRIDHYLGKELVQNIMVFRFANPLYNDLWNNAFIDNVQITIAETLGVETRGRYYDKSGAVRDMLQNHLLQILSLVGMEAPTSLSADDIRDRKVALLKAVQPVQPEAVVAGQYSGGLINGNAVASYREEPDVSSDSHTETYIAAKALINNDRWKGVPFYLRTGKRLKERYSDVVLVLKDTACRLFQSNAGQTCPNIIRIRIQPDEGIAVRFNAKIPGAEVKLQPVHMDFCHKCTFEHNTPEAYELLIEQILRGNQTLFTRWDEVEQNWKIVAPLLQSAGEKHHFYASGTEGPAEANTLLEKEGRRWIDK